MKKKYILFTLIGVTAPIFFCCRTPDKSLSYTVTINDSLYWERKSGDSLITVKGSYLPLVVLPKDMKDGDVITKKEGQANLTVRKEKDTLYLEASCDSLQFRISFLEEKLTRVNKQNEDLQQQIKAAPNKWNWFFRGLGIGIFLMGVVMVWLSIKFRKA